ncbi:MAG TPA: hypothetical protein VJ205_03150 [Gammaproteobacteria bacterium]|nr:hypothetical protein [Gammaproteobacteria bacterium]
MNNKRTPNLDNALKLAVPFITQSHLLPFITEINGWLKVER